MTKRISTNILWLLLMLVASMSSSEALEPSWISKDLRADNRPEVEQLASQLVKINDDLKAKLPDDSSLDVNIKRIEKQSKCSNWKTCFKSDDPEKKQALKQLASLRSQVGVCDIQSAISLDTANAALERCANSELDRLRSIIKFYQEKHMQFCGPAYQGKYLELIRSLNEDARLNIRRVHAALDALSPLDFSQVAGIDRSLMVGAPMMYKEQVELMMMPDFVIKRDAPEAVARIARAIGQYLFKNPRWDLSINPWDSIRDPGTDEAALNKILDEYLFEPCDQFRNELADALQPALIVSTFRNDMQKHFVTGSQDFFEAMQAFEVCKKLLQEREQLYPELSATLRTLSPELFGGFD